MQLQDLVNYVNLDVDDSFSTLEITRWFNKGIAQYNLIPPVTTYPYVQLSGQDGDEEGKIYYDTTYPLDETFMLGVMLPYINASVRSQDSSLSEKQLFLSEFIAAASRDKPQSNVPLTYLKDKKNTDLEIFQLGNNVYVSDMTRSPFTNSWSSHAVYAEVTSSVDVVFYDAQLSADSRKAARLAMGSRLSEFMTEAGVTGTIYSDVNLTQAIPASTIITSSAVYYYG
jgi:hypothetical protein